MNSPSVKRTMGRNVVMAAAVIFLPVGSVPAQQPFRVALVGATLIDGTNAAPIPNATILIEGA